LLCRNDNPITSSQLIKETDEYKQIVTDYDAAKDLGKVIKNTSTQQEPLEIPEALEEAEPGSSAAAESRQLQRQGQPKPRKRRRSRRCALRKRRKKKAKTLEPVQGKIPVNRNRKENLK
jgi:hypothetical protein